MQTSSFKFRRYTNFPFNWWRGAMTFKPRSKGVKRGHAPPQKSTRKWHKIDKFLDIRRKQSNFYSLKFGLCYLLGHKQAISHYFSNIGVPFWIVTTPKALSLDPPLMSFSRHWNFCKKKGCMGRHPILPYCSAESGFTNFRFQAMTQYPEKSDQWDAR